MTKIMDEANGFDIDRIAYTGESITTNKFEIGRVERQVRVNGQREIFWKKQVRTDLSPEAQSRALSDLMNESNWNCHTHLQLAKFGINIPLPMFTARNYVLFKEIIGDKPDEAQLQELLPNIAYLCAAVASLNFPRQKNILSPKMEERILQLLPADISKLQNRELLLADDVVEKIKTLFATKLHKYLVPGTVHGDINLKNILLVKMARLQDQGMALVDSEFGTDYAKPAFDKPRFQDGAYFYHLLYCQYHRPDLAEQFMRLYSNALKDAGVEMETSFQFEFYASVLERTVSMGNHFVWNRAEGKIIDDTRRIEPVPYHVLTDLSISVLTSA